MALGVERRAADQRHHVEAVDLIQPHAAREGGEDRARPPGSSAPAISAQRWAWPRPTPLVGMKTISAGAGSASPTVGAPTGAPPRAEQAQDRLGRRLDRGAAPPHVLGDPAQVGQDLGIEEAVEPEDAGRRRDEGVVLAGKPVAGAAVEERHPGDEQVRDERLQPVTAARSPKTTQTSARSARSSGRTSP